MTTFVSSWCLKHKLDSLRFVWHILLTSLIIQENYGKSLDKEVESFLKKGEKIVNDIESLQKELFPYGPGKLSEVESIFEKEMVDTG